jgi:hypothetical protein
MTTRPARLGAALFGIGAALIILACGDSHTRWHADTVDVSSYPADIQQAYKVFANRCSRCHPLSRPLNSTIRDPQHWIRYVQRMRLQPGSGIDAQNGAVILRFLLYYHGERAKGGASHE